MLTPSCGLSLIIFGLAHIPATPVGSQILDYRNAYM